MNDNSHPQDCIPASEAVKWLALEQECAPANHWDEMRGEVTPSADVQPAVDLAKTASPICGPWQTFIKPLASETAGLGPDLNARMANLQRQVRDNGITYNVYSADDQPQRPWSLDLFPLLVDAASWQHIEAGVLQRVRLLERVRNELEPYGTVEQFPKLEGRQMIMVMAPKKK